MMDLRIENGGHPPGCRTTGRLALLSVSLLALSSTALAEVGLEGTEYSLIGRIPGDQTHPAVTFGSQRGFVAWQDNATDGSGLGIRARRIDASGAATAEAFRVNESADDDQEAVALATLKDGSTIFAWLGGKRGQQGVFVRVLSPDGMFVRGEHRISAAGLDCRAPSVAALSGGGAVLTWAALGADGDGLGVIAQRLDAVGAPVGGAIPVNQYTWDNQRNPQVAAGEANTFAIAWVSDLQNGRNRADVYVRTFDSQGNGASESRINPGSAPCNYPALASVPGGWVAAWSSTDLTSEIQRFNVHLRWLGTDAFPLQATQVASGAEGDHLRPCLAVSGERIMVSWNGTKLDSHGMGIGGRVYAVNGQSQGDTLTLNAISRGDQVTPAVAPIGDGRFLSVWSTWSGLDRGMDLAAQRVAQAAAPLAAPAAPVVAGMNSWQVKATWAPVEGLPVDHYEVYFDGNETPETTAESYWTSPDVLPATMHTVQVAYVLSDGRKSPRSAMVAGKSWGKDANSDGLPDDWQTSHFGTNALAWPSPLTDTDKDGVSDRDEFLAGTDPNNAADVLKVDLLQTGQGPQLSWTARPGGIYQLQMTTDLNDWSNVGGYRFAAGTSDSVVLEGAPLNAYFRVNRIR